MEVVASLSQGRTAAAQCGLFTYKSVPVIFEPPCITKQSASLAAVTQVLKGEVRSWAILQIQVNKVKEILYINQMLTSSVNAQGFPRKQICDQLHRE